MARELCSLNLSLSFFMNTYTIPTILIILDLGSAIVYAFNGDKGRTLYWVSAAVITYSTFIIK